MGRKHRLREVIGKFFAFARPENWLVSKIPPLLAVAYFASLRFNVDASDATRLLVCSMVSIFCVAIYGHVVNDIFDLEVDRLANKVNRLAAMSPARRASTALAFLIAGFLPAVFTTYSLSTLSLLTLNYLWPTIYSIPGTRLKERGLLGVACDALGSHVTPTLFILSLFMPAAPISNEIMLTVIVTTLWSTVLGLKGILHHQIADRDSDIQSGVVTFATKESVTTLQRFVVRFNLLVELPTSALFVLLVSPWCPLSIFAFLLYTGSEFTKYRLGFQFALTSNPATIRASLPFTNEMFYVLWMPMAAAVQLGMCGPGFVWIPLLHAFVFRQPIRQQMRDWYAILQQLRTRFGAAKPHDVALHYNDAYAAEYEKKFLLDPLVRTDTESELRLIGEYLTPGVNWLDVACGTGFFLRHFSHVQRAGIDISPAMLRVARQGNPDIILREHDFLKPIPEWKNKWELVSCMWYAYGFAGTVANLDRLIENLWSWTAMNGKCFMPIADPRLISGVNLPYQAPTHNSGRVMITGIMWSYIEDDIGAAHAHLLAPNIEFMVELFQQYFEHVEVIRYPPPFEGWQGRPALIANGKKPLPNKMPAAGPWVVKPDQVPAEHDIA
jgi:4-hydroxybenzoate polyprenyltransferase/SAM-dependent methyltransferase